MVIEMFVDYSLHILSYIADKGYGFTVINGLQSTFAHTHSYIMLQSMRWYGCFVHAKLYFYSVSWEKNSQRIYVSLHW